MSGTISLSSDTRWSAASWLFDWVLQKIADDIPDVELSTSIRGLLEQNIGWFSLDELTPSQEARVRQIMQGSLVGSAEREFPDVMPGRADALSLLRDLAGLAAT